MNKKEFTLKELAIMVRDLVPYANHKTEAIEAIIELARSKALKFDEEKLRSIAMGY